MVGDAFLDFATGLALQPIKQASSAVLGTTFDANGRRLRCMIDPDRGPAAAAWTDLIFDTSVEDARADGRLNRRRHFRQAAGDPILLAASKIERAIKRTRGRRHHGHLAGRWIDLDD